ncbi:uncharacterized protein LOC131050798 isoform X2 [Cryptomeria japonica]|nr:uncharacterized protein LOC131050798 isoform X2 [Cryptomeria japonica]
MVVKCSCLVSNGRKLPMLVHLSNHKLSSRWNTGLQRLGLRASKFGYSMIQRPFVVKSVATFSELDKTLPDLQEEKMNYNNEVQNIPNQVSIDDLKERDSRINETKMKNRKSNKGFVPWNKGKKHSPETIARIRERTRLAMQDLKVRKKLEENYSRGRAQSEETRMKIGKSVRMATIKRHEKQKLQETCLLEWKETIAEAAKLGCNGEDELQWDSYEILAEKIHQDWLQAVQLRKRGPRPPKSVEQKMKISEAVKAKWADPDYRQRVQAGFEKVYKNRLPSAVRRVVRKRSCKVGEQLPSHKTQVKISEYSQVNRRKSSTTYSDPLVDAKLEKIKQLRANREENEMTKHEAFERARLLIAETEKAAKTLEAAAMIDNAARASLFETKKLLAEAVKTMQSVESALRGNAHSLMRSPQTSLDEKASQADKNINNSHIPASAAPGPGDEDRMHYLSFSSTCEADNYDSHKSNNGALSGSIYKYSHKPGHLTEIGGEKVLSYVASQFSTRNLSAEETALIFNLMSEKTIEKDSMSHFEEISASTSMAVNYAGIVNETSISQIVEAHMPEQMKDNILSVTTNSVASTGPIQNISELSEVRPFQASNNDILSSKKNVKKRWVCGRLIEAKED